MGTQNLPKIPVINFTKENMKPGSSSWISTCNEVRQALESYGIFLAIDDRISSGQRTEIFSASQKLFNLPTETKVKNTFEISPYFGYLGPKPGIMPLYESLGLGDATNLLDLQSFANTMWPSGNPHFCETMHWCGMKLSEIYEMVSKMIFESYGVEKYYEDHKNAVSYLHRVMKYRAPELNEINVGASAHTDKCFLGILFQNQVDGLEVKTKDGEWISVDFPPSSLVIMAGEALTAWSNGRVHSAIHRVTINGKESRYSMVQFSFIKGIPVEAPRELVDDDHPLKYKPFDNFGLLCFYRTPQGQKAQDLLKAYSGV